jgi:hypothetical protein
MTAETRGQRVAVTFRSGKVNWAMTDSPADGWFVRSVGDDHQLWNIARGRATRAGVTSPERGPGTYFESKPGETIWEVLRRDTPWFDGQIAPGPFVPVDNAPGQFFPRMARPVIGEGLGVARLPDGENDRRYLRSSQTQLEALLADVDAICRVVEPSGDTLGVYGHEIRNLLILAATEVEMHMAGVMIANGNAQQRLTTSSYVKLADPLRLRDFSVRFHRYPDVGSVMPFSGWDSQAPSQSLAWYDAYNAVKHDRGGQFARATLANALSAVGACASLLVAQFGDVGLSDELNRSMEVVATPWPLKDLYVAPQHFRDWAPTHHPALR